MLLLQLMIDAPLTAFSLLLSIYEAVSSSLFSLVLVLLGAPACLFFACRLPPSPSLSHWTGVTMGHRGCRTNLNIPENSLQAFRYAQEHGADALELDVSLTSDGRIVCMHDGDVRRTCEGEGEVGTMTFAQANALRFRKTGKRVKESEPVEPEIEKRKRWNAPTPHAAPPAAAAAAAIVVPEPEYGAEWLPSVPLPPTLLAESVDGPPSLEQVVLFARHHRLKLMIECKEWRRPALLFSLLLDLFSRHPFLYRHAFISTFNPYHIYLLRTLSLALPTCLLYCRDCLQWYHADGSREMQLPALLNHRPVRWLCDQLLVELLPLLLLFLHPSAVGPQNTVLSIEQCERMRRRGMMIDVWCVNRRSELELWREEGAIVTTDFIFPLRDRRGEGREEREGMVRWKEEEKQRDAEHERELHAESVDDDGDDDEPQLRLQTLHDAELSRPPQPQAVSLAASYGPNGHVSV